MRCLDWLKGKVGAARGAVWGAVVAGIVLGGVVVFGAGCKPAGMAEGPLVVGMDLTYPPFETIGPDGRPQGVSVDLARALGEFLGREVRIENIPFTGLIPALQSGKIDLIVSSMTRTAEREQSIAFSEPYLTIGLALLVGANSTVQSAADLDQPGRVIAVRHGTTGQTWAARTLRNARVLVLDKENTAVMEVVQGKADAFVYDQMSVWKQAQQHPETTRALLEPLQTEHWAIGLRRGDEALRERVNAFLADFKRRGGFEELGWRYLREQKEAFAKLGLPFYF